MPKHLSPFPHCSCTSLGFVQGLNGIPPSVVISFVPAFLVNSDIREGTFQCRHFPFRLHIAQDLKPESPHMPCHWHSYVQIKASATVSTWAAAALQTNRKGDMTKQVKSLAMCVQRCKNNYYSALCSWTDNLANFSNSSKKAETSLAAETSEKDHDLLCFL